MSNILWNEKELQSIESISRFDESGTPYEHPVESELLAHPPRVAHPTGKTILKRRVFWNVLVGIVVLALFFGRRDLTTWDDLMSRGVPIQASVMDKYEEVRKGKSYYHVTYEFRAPDADCDGEMEVPYEDYTQRRVGQPILVTYLPGSHGEIWQQGNVTEQDRSDRLATWIFVTLLALSAVSAMFAACHYEWQTQLRLLRNGTAVVGCVESGKVIRAKSTTYRLDYRYPTGYGTSQTAVLYVDPALYQRYTTGSPLFTVVYDPGNEKINRVYFRITAARLDSIDAIGESGSVMPV